MKEMISNKWMGNVDALKNLLEAKETGRIVTQVEPCHGLVKVMKYSLRSNLDSITYQKKRNSNITKVKSFESDVNGLPFVHKT